MSLAYERNFELCISLIPFYSYFFIFIFFLVLVYSFKNIIFPCLNYDVCLLIVQNKKNIVIGPFDLLKYK